MEEEFKGNTAKEVAGKTVGRHGLLYITTIVVITVVASFFLTPGAMTAVMAMVGGVLMAIINMMHGITGTPKEPEKPEFQIIQSLIERIDRLGDRREPPMQVLVDDNEVKILHGQDSIVTKRNGPPMQLAE